MTSARFSQVGSTGFRWKPDLSRLFHSVDCDTLVYFRIVFSATCCCWVLKQLLTGAVTKFYVEPRFHFHYFGFEWVGPFPGQWTHVEFMVILIAAVAMAAGIYYRFAAAVFAIGFTHLFLTDKCLYQNHYYLICVLSWLMVLVPASNAFSLDARTGLTDTSSVLPQWSVWLLRFQLGVPYFFGGLAKLNPDWLAGEPMRFMLARRIEFPLMGQFFDQEWCVYAMAYGGLVFDLLIVPALLSRRFRIPALIAALVFHGLNAWLFTIGVFPWLMLLSLPVFLPPGSVRKLLRLQPLVDTSTDLHTVDPNDDRSGWSIRRGVLAVALLAFVTWQSLFPLRHYLIPGNSSWTEEAHCFSWHMLVRGKLSALRYSALDTRTHRSGTIDLRRYVTAFQLNRVSRDPRLILQLAHLIGDDLVEKGFGDVELRALALVSMNGRKPQLLVDPSVNLLAERSGWRRPDWIVPLTEELRFPYWDTPITEWDKILDPSVTASRSLDTTP